MTTPEYSNELSPDCHFCVPSRGSDRPYVAHFAVSGRERLDQVVLFQTENIKVLPDLLPVHPDGLHLLLIPKPHRYSFAAIPELSDEVGITIKALEKMTNEQLIVFEHGGTKEGGSNQSVYHQHAHLIGSQEKNVLKYMSEVLDQAKIEYERISTTDASPIVNLQSIFQNHGYFYIQQGRSGLMAHDPNDRFPSQLAQLNMSQLLTGNGLNWKQIPTNDDLARLSIERIINLIDICKR